MGSMMIHVTIYSSTMDPMGYRISPGNSAGNYISDVVPLCHLCPDFVDLRTLATAAETEKPLLDAPGDNAVSLVDLYRFIYGNYVIYIIIY
jgi:hypothetical protein